MKRLLLFLVAILAVIVGLIKLTMTVEGLVPSTQYVVWLMLYTVGILGMVFSMQRLYSVQDNLTGSG